MSILNVIGSLLGSKDKSIFQEIRELIKGKEEDPQKIIDLTNQVNAMEAQHRSVFVAGWRPACGWVCALTLFFHYIVFPFITTYTMYDVPELDTSFLNTLLMGMLGLGGMRTYEKLKNKTK